MKIIILTISCICINMNMYAQKYFSKMFDIEKQWESIDRILTTKEGKKLYVDSIPQSV